MLNVSAQAKHGIQQSNLQMIRSFIKTIIQCIFFIWNSYKDPRTIQKLFEMNGKRKEYVTFPCLSELEEVKKPNEAIVQWSNISLQIFVRTWSWWQEYTNVS